MCHFDEISEKTILSDEFTFDPVDSETKLRETCDGESGFDDPHEHEEK